MSSLPVVVIVGRPNVGKSTLVNRIVGGRQAVVEEMPGVTRDRREFVGEWSGKVFALVDTGGWELHPGEDISTAIRDQAEAAVRVADVVLFVVDASTGISEDDRGVIRILRASRAPVILAANKIDDQSHERRLDELWSLGLGEPVAVSAFHGRGVGDLLDRVVAALPDAPSERPEDDLPRLAIVGRPNVGKSTLLNRLMGEERVIVSETPGTTRDPIDVVVDINGIRYRLIDTAGIRRKPQITEDADYYAVLRAKEVIAGADVVLLVIDAPHGVTNQDQRIATETVKAGAGIVVVLNKWDAIDDDARTQIDRDLADQLGFISWAPVIRISALTGARLGKLAPMIEATVTARATRIPTGVLNRNMTDWTGAHPPPVRKGRRTKIQYMVQAGTRPPTFVLFISGGELGEDYLRFLEGRIRGTANLEGTPVHIVTRAKR